MLQRSTKTNKVEKGIWELKKVQRAKFEQKRNEQGTKTTAERNMCNGIYCSLVHWMLWLSSYVIFQSISFSSSMRFKWFSSTLFVLFFVVFFSVRSSLSPFFRFFRFQLGNNYLFFRRLNCAFYIWKSCMHCSIQMSLSIFQLLLRSGGDHIVVDRRVPLLGVPCMGVCVCVLVWKVDDGARFCKICMQLNKTVRCIIKITEFAITPSHALCKLACVAIV